MAINPQQRKTDQQNSKLFQQMKEMKMISKLNLMMALFMMMMMTMMMMIMMMIMMMYRTAVMTVWILHKFKFKV